MSKKFVIEVIIIILIIVFFLVVFGKASNWYTVKVINKWDEGFYQYILVENIDSGEQERIAVNQNDFDNMEKDSTYEIKTTGYNSFSTRKYLHRWKIQK